MPIPPNVDAAFLDWFRSTTEAAWAAFHPPTFADWVARCAIGPTWQQGTRWLGGLSEQELAVAETRWSVRFPPDYRLFLATLHTVERPRRGAGYDDDEHRVR